MADRNTNTASLPTRGSICRDKRTKWDGLQQTAPGCLKWRPRFWKHHVDYRWCCSYLLYGCLPACADCYLFRKGLDATESCEKYSTYLNRFQQQLVIKTQRGSRLWGGWEYKQPHTSMILTCRVEQELCVQRDCSEYFPSDGEQARGSTVSTYGPEPIDSCWVDFDAPSVFGRLLSHFPLHPPRANLWACLLNLNAC